MNAELKTARRIALASVVALAIAGCAATSTPPERAPLTGFVTSVEIDAVPVPVLALRSSPTPSLERERAGAVSKIGKPYQVAGQWYYPRHQPDYDASGSASWYGDDFHGKHTANGEIYNMHRLTAAHPTLPLPSYVEVTNLANGRSIIARVNDRGPYKRGRILDLSRKAADLLGYRRSGTTDVRVRYIGPAPLGADDTKEQAYLRRQTWYHDGLASNGN